MRLRSPTVQLRLSCREACSLPSRPRSVVVIVALFDLSSDGFVLLVAGGEPGHERHDEKHNHPDDDQEVRQRYLYDAPVQVVAAAENQFRLCMHGRTALSDYVSLRASICVK